MRQDPYARMVQIMRKQGETYNPPAIGLGVVVSVDPFILRFGDIEITKEQVYIADYLLEYEREFKKAHINADEHESNIKYYYNDHVSDPKIIHKIKIDLEQSENASVVFDIGLKENDIVAVLPTYDQQTFIILSRVVRIDG